MDVEDGPSSSKSNEPSAEILSQIEVGDDGLTAIQRLFRRQMKGRWMCTSNCNTTNLNKYAKCQACGEGLRPAHIKPPEDEEKPKTKSSPWTFQPTKDPNSGFNFQIGQKKVPVTRPEKSPFDTFQFKPQGLPGESNPFSPNTESNPFSPNTPGKSDENNVPSFFPKSSPDENSTPSFNFPNSKNSSPGGFKFEPSSNNEDDNNVNNPHSLIRKRPSFPLPSTPTPHKPPLAGIGIFGNKPPLTVSSRFAGIKTGSFTNQPSPATHLSSMTINPIELDPGTMCDLLKQCLNEARESDKTDFILACGYGGMGSTGLGDIPDEEENANPEEGSDAEMEDDDEEYVDPYEAAVPTFMFALPDMQWSDLDCGAFNAGCVSSCGTAFVWGTNDHGNLGISNTVVSTQFEPLEASFPEKVCIRKIGMGGSHTVFCDSKGQVWTAGTFKSDGEVGHHVDVDSGRIVVNQKSFMKIEKYSSVCVANMRDKDRTLPPIVDVQSGADHFLMLDDTGHIWEMGITVMGQRSSKRNQKKYLIPRKSPLVGSRAHLRFKKIRCGSHFNLAISREGDLYSWGQNMWMQCGHPRPELENEDDALEPHEAVIDLPTKIQFPIPVKIVDCSAGEHFAIALDSFNRVWSWGRNASNTLGRETQAPAKKENQNHENEVMPDLPKQVRLPPIAKINAGPAHWFALTKIGRVHAFGVSTEHRAGLGLDAIEDEEKVKAGAHGDTVFDNRNLHDDFAVVNMSGGSQHSLFHLRKIIRSGSNHTKRKMSDEFYAPAAKLNKP